MFDIFRSNKSSNDMDTSANTKKVKDIHITTDDDRRAFSSYSQQSGLPPLENWPTGVSTVVTPSLRASDICFDLPDNDTSLFSDVKTLPMNGDVVRFDGPNFEGKLVSRMRDVPLHPCKASSMTNAEYFSNRSRQYQWTVQGRFKRRIRFDHVVTGQEFGRPFRNMPSSTMVKRGLDLLKHKLPETFEWLVLILQFAVNIISSSCVSAL